MRVQIDGSYGEGGGQILRTSVALAAITGREVEMVRIRAGRSKPGLQPQHLAAVRAAAALCEAQLQGGTPGSARLLFTPRSPVSPGDWRFEIGTAGAATLVAQTAALPLALAGGDSRVTVTGGTHVPHAPPADFLEAVWAPAPCVDSHLADQLVLPAALASGESAWTAPEATPHLRTALWVVERFLPVRSRIQEAGGCVRVTLESQGVENR